MSVVLELFFQFLAEFVAYGVGRATFLIFAPHYGVESGDKPPRRPWNWRGWSFERDGRRYLYIETVQLVGLLVLVSFAVVIALARQQRG